jgi:uncharacterized protein YbcC (UPF0753/DUF2309 family)
MKSPIASAAEPEVLTDAGSLTKRAPFNEADVIHELHHYLPEQAALKDFIHQNTLHAFQSLPFFDGLRHASQILGYNVCFSLEQYRDLYRSGKIGQKILANVAIERKGIDNASEWVSRMLTGTFDPLPQPRIGALRSNWKRLYRMDMDSMVHPTLFRLLCSYLDQGISVWGFPVRELGLLAAIREMETHSFSSFFRSKRAKKLLVDGVPTIPQLLKILLGSDDTHYKQYLFDQQFAHQGWSGIAAIVERMPETLLDRRKISLHDLIVLELLMEIDALDFSFGKWQPMQELLARPPVDLFAKVPASDLHEALATFQDAFEWTYYDQVLAGLSQGRNETKRQVATTFQAMFCIDDREESFRRYLEKLDPFCGTYATPGFFGIDCYFQPEGGKFYTKICPAPMSPNYLIKESEIREKRETDIHFSKHSHSFYTGWLISQTIGFWSATKLLINIFKPSISPATSSSFRHMDRQSQLTIENRSVEHRENGLQVGYTIQEMAARVEGVLKSTGLVKDFAPLVYIVGHGASSVNNPHFAAYDCGACSGRPGSVNSRAFCHMANHFAVRDILATRGISIPDTTQFIGGLHDTTRDEIDFFDEQALSEPNKAQHRLNVDIMTKALDLNARERSRRFTLIDSHKAPLKVHNDVKLRSVSLFEPRPELNHATNTLCIIGRRSLTQHLFLDRRSFYNSYDYTIDPEGVYLLNILRPAAPVCGGINLEYFFSRVDNQKLGAGTKLPHNVMGLIGVANGIDGDLRPGLPSQMIEMHDPVRLMTIVEHYPEVLLSTLKKSPETFDWFTLEWIHLVAIHPDTGELFVLKKGAFVPYHPHTAKVEVRTDLTKDFEKSEDNLPVFQLA